MKSSKFAEMVEPIIGTIGEKIYQLDSLTDSGLGERTMDTVVAAVNALDAANRLLVLAFEESRGAEFVP